MTDYEIDIVISLFVICLIGISILYGIAIGRDNFDE
jgi:hypothetical protein